MRCGFNSFEIVRVWYKKEDVADEAKELPPRNIGKYYASKPAHVQTCWAHVCPSGSFEILYYPTLEEGNSLPSSASNPVLHQNFTVSKLFNSPFSLFGVTCCPRVTFLLWYCSCSAHLLYLGQLSVAGFPERFASPCYHRFFQTSQAIAPRRLLSLLSTLHSRNLLRQQ